MDVFYNKEIIQRVGQLAQQEKMHDAKPDNLSSVPGL